jgi:AcrR family transcriptional regulator
MARPRGHGPEYELRKQEIIDAAAQIFAQRGYAGVGVQELCREVDLGKGALYYYIGSKENLLVEIQDRVLGPLLELAVEIQAQDAAPLVKMRLLSQLLLDIILDRLDHIWVYEHDYRLLTGENRKRFKQRRREFEDILTASLKGAAESGLLQIDDLKLAMYQFLNLHNHTYQWARELMKWSASDLSTVYFRTLMLGFGGTSEAVAEAEAEARDILKAKQKAEKSTSKA